MIWRIGERLDFIEQLEWVREQRFQEVSFWSYPGDPGKWQGFDLVAAGKDALARLKALLRDFEDVDIHAPSAPWSDLDTGLVAAEASARGQALERLRRLLDRSAECGAKILTVHGGHCGFKESDAGLEPSEWHKRMLGSLAQADALARSSGVKIGMELTTAYDLVSNPDLTHIGLTVDTGHMQFENGAGYRDYGSLGALIERVGPRVFHMHVHDYDGKHDHLAIGRGRINFQEILSALSRIGYNGSLCLELNPAAVSPDEILEGRATLLRMREGL